MATPRSPRLPPEPKNICPPFVRQISSSSPLHVSESSNTSQRMSSNSKNNSSNLHSVIMDCAFLQITRRALDLSPGSDRRIQKSLGALLLDTSHAWLRSATSSASASRRSPVSTLCSQLAVPARYHRVGPLQERQSRSGPRISRGLSLG